MSFSLKAEMVKFLKQNKIVIVLQGRFVGWKTVSVCSFADGTCGQPYGCCLVAEIAKYLKKAIQKESTEKMMKKAECESLHQAHLGLFLT